MWLVCQSVAGPTRVTDCWETPVPISGVPRTCTANIICGLYPQIDASFPTNMPDRMAYPSFFAILPLFGRVSL